MVNHPIRVADTGQGIPADVLEHLEPDSLDVKLKGGPPEASVVLGAVVSFA